MSLFYDEYILEYHVTNVLSYNFDEVFESSDFYNIKCNVCGDSKKNPYLKRGYILKNKEPWVYYCHNCQTSMSVIKWMKEYFPDDYKRYMTDVIKQNKKEISDYNKRNKFKKHNSRDNVNEKEYTKYFKSILKFDDCIEWCKNRKIPKEVYSKWYYAVGGLYKGRIIITFRNEKGKIYYYQGRKFNNKQGVKYLSRYGDHNSIYNYYTVDMTKPVPILEGPIDSIFVENSIAVTGLKLKNELLDNIKHKYFILDNDKSGDKQSIKLLEQGHYVFNWKKFLKKYKCSKSVKDVNDFILYNNDNLYKLKWDIIKDFFTNRITDKIFFKRI